MIKQYIAKIEGHGTLNIDFQKNKVNLYIEEGERLIEGIMLDRMYYDAPFITSRICGVCPIAHHTASVVAIENAFRIKIDRTTQRLRNLMICAQMIQSHALHLYFLSLSDYLDAKSTLSLSESNPKIFQDALNIKKYSDHLADVSAGRNVHPITPTIGGFLSIPTKNDLKKMLSEYQETYDSIINTIKLFSTIKYPHYSHPTTYLSLSSKSQYPTISNQIESSTGEVFYKKNYTQNIIEKVRTDSPSKYATYKEKPFMLGALSRLSINARKLNPIAKQLYKKYIPHLGNFPAYNSFHNNFAQAIEIVHFFEQSKIIIEKIISDKSYKYKNPARIKLKHTHGCSTIEAPRGILYHYYEISSTGKIKNCNIITPTAQSLTNLELDCQELMHQTLDLSQKKRTHLIEMLIRAYDPCITCSVH
jgi:coenzyme F420-reducing hydrogenase alpha subunit